MTATAHRTRCSACGRALRFADWTRGRPLCEPCARPAVPRPVPPPSPSALAPGDDLIDAIPEAILDELVAALEAEASKLDQANPLAGVLAELELGRTPRERHWAAWGFAAGFALNAGIAKWAQVASGAPISQFLAPILIGGLFAGATCAVIGWGLARLRQPA